MSQRQLDKVTQTVLLEMISSVSRANEQAEILNQESQVDQTQVATLKLRAEYLRQRLAQLRLQAENSTAFLEKMKKLTYHLRDHHVDRYATIRLQNIERNFQLADTLPKLEQQIDERESKLRELEKMIAEEEMIRELQSRNMQGLSETAGARTKYFSLSYTDIESLKKKVDEHYGFLRYLEPTLVADGDSPRMQSRKDRDNSGVYERRSYQDPDTDSDSGHESRG